MRDVLVPGWRERAVEPGGPDVERRHHAVGGRDQPAVDPALGGVRLALAAELHAVEQRQPRRVMRPQAADRERRAAVLQAPVGLGLPQIELRRRVGAETLDAGRAPANRRERAVEAEAGVADLDAADDAVDALLRVGAVAAVGLREPGGEAGRRLGGAARAEGALAVEVDLLDRRVGDLRGARLQRLVVEDRRHHRLGRTRLAPAVARRAERVAGAQARAGAGRLVIADGLDLARADRAHAARDRQPLADRQPFGGAAIEVGAVLGGELHASEQRAGRARAGSVATCGAGVASGTAMRGGGGTTITARAALEAAAAPPVLVRARRRVARPAERGTERDQRDGEALSATKLWHS